MSKARILSGLNRSVLLEIAQEFEIAGLSGKSKAEIVSVLTSDSAIPLQACLDRLWRDELKALCRKLDLDDSGRKKIDLIARILQNTRAVASQAPNHPKNGSKRMSTATPPPEETAPAQPSKPANGFRGWIDNTPPEGNGELEKRLWSAADELRANSKLKASEYSVPVLGLIFLRFADFLFTRVETELEGKATARRKIGKADYHARHCLYLPPEARFSNLIQLPEGENIGKRLNEAMKAIEAENPDLAGTLQINYTPLENATLVSLLKIMSSIPMSVSGDKFGKIYEYFLGKFAMSEGQKGGEFFTPESLVKLIVEIIEPFHGRIYDPACGSGGMFVWSADFVKRHQSNPNAEISIYGQERVAETVRLCKMNLAVHGLGGDIREGNTYYEDIHQSPGRFDFVMANPPFNVDRIDKDRLKDDPRFPYGLPRPDNGNYIWIQQFASALNDTGCAGFVMANSASDARGSEQNIRRGLIEDRLVDVMIAIGSNMFYTVTLPCTLWFLDRGKRKSTRKDEVLFIDARHIHRQIDRAHRDFTPAQIEFIANIARLWRGEAPEADQGSKPHLNEYFPKGKYADVPGLCKSATIEEIAKHGYSLNPGRYVGVADADEEDFDFLERLEELNEELEKLNLEAHELEEQIAENVTVLLEGAEK